MFVARHIANSDKFEGITEAQAEKVITVIADSVRAAIAPEAMAVALFGSEDAVTFANHVLNVIDRLTADED